MAELTKGCTRILFPTMAYLKSRWRYLRECYEHCKQHKGVAIVTLIFAAYSLIASIAPIVEMPVIHWPKLPPAWAAVIVLCAILFIVIEGGYRLHQGNDLSNPAALATLPVFRHDVDVRLIAMCTGTSLRFDGTVFMLIKARALKNLHMIKLSASVTTTRGRQDGVIMSDLSEWLLSEEFFDEGFRMTNRKETNMASMSLVKEIESGIFNEGHHPAKWIGCELKGDPYVGDNDIRGVTLSFHDTNGIAKTELFDKFPASSYKVIDVQFRLRQLL